MQKELIHEIESFVRENPANLQEDGETPYFEEPLIGIASASDPLFRQYKQIIGDYHLTPAEWIPEAESVICWVLPVAEQTRLSNRKEKTFPSRAWARTRDQGEAFNVLLRRHLVAWLGEQGYKALAPQLSDRWQGVEVMGSGPSSNWSERHAAYAAGLGTFSLNDALITAKGITHRLGSVITDCRIPSTYRNVSGYRSNCLRFSSGGCGACIARCPVGALSDEGHDKYKCRNHVYRTIPETVADKYQVKFTGCGLCQTKVPCECCIPRGAD